jgi:hypothetical protein
MDTSKMTDIALPVQFFGHDCKPGRLLEIKTRRRNQIPCGKEVRQLGTNIKIDTGQDFCKVSF